MASERQVKANQANASQSTGPRTLGGKLRSRNNAIRHGLASPIANDPGAAEIIARLASLLVEQTSHSLDFHQAQALAEIQIERLRIQNARERVAERLSHVQSSEEAADLLNELMKISRYEERAFSRRRRLFRHLSQRSLKQDE